MMMNKPNQQEKITSSGDTHHKNFTFLPMLCSSSSSSSSSKQVKASHRRCASSSSSSSSTTSSSTVSDDPSSPKVGCMGQVKKNNKVIGFPNIITSTTSSNSSNSSHNNSINSIIKCHQPNNYTSNNMNIIKYYKIKRFFSTKSPTSVIPLTKTATAPSRKPKIGTKNAANVIVCNSKGNEDKSCNKKSHQDNNNNNNKGNLVNLVEMDPPLPVVKKALHKEQENNEEDKMGTLWKRRSGGAPLQTLRLQLIQPNIISPLTANTV